MACMCEWAVAIGAALIPVTKHDLGSMWSGVAKRSQGALLLAPYTH